MPTARDQVFFLEVEIGVTARLVHHFLLKGWGRRLAGINGFAVYSAARAVAPICGSSAPDL